MNMIRKNAILLMFLLISYTACTQNMPDKQGDITLREWTLDVRDEQIQNTQSWHVYRSPGFPLGAKELMSMIQRGESVNESEHIADNQTGTWFINAGDPLPNILKNVNFTGDTVTIDGESHNLNGRYLFTIVPVNDGNMYHEIIISGPGAEAEQLPDILNKKIFFSASRLIYERGLICLPKPEQPKKDLIRDQPVFPEASLYADWMQKIRQSTVPSVVGEAFEAFVTRNQMPLVLDSLVTFFWFEPSGNDPVYLLSDLTGWDATPQNRMKRIQGTHIHFYQTALHREGRIEYLYRMANEVKRDYLNPQYTGSGYFSHSVLIMPDRKPAPEISQPPLAFQSAIDEFTSDNGNRIRLILPPGYHQASSTYRTLYILNSYQNMFIIRTLMENLMLSGEIPPVIVVFAGNEPLKNLVQTLDERYRTMKKPEYRILCAWSGETDRLMIDNTLWENYLLFSPLDMPIIPDDKVPHFTLNISTGLYDLSEADFITRALKTRYPDHTVIHYFPGGHHPEEWYRALIRELKRMM